MGGNGGDDAVAGDAPPMGEAVEAPEKARQEMRIWNAEQVGRVLRAATDDSRETLRWLAIYTGMRHMARLEQGEPRSRSVAERIALSAFVVESLKCHRVRQLEHRLATGDASEDRGYVFANETGGHLHSNVPYRRCAALIARAGVPVIRFHDLRHTSATLMLAEGVDGEIVQERLGHANTVMRLDLYSHVAADMERDAADALEAAITNAGKRSA